MTIAPTCSHNNFASDCPYIECRRIAQLERELAAAKTQHRYAGHDIIHWHSRREKAEARIAELEFALKGLHDDNADYLRLNNLGGYDNHWMLAARKALGIAAPHGGQQEATSSNAAGQEQNAQPEQAKELKTGAPAQPAPAATLTDEQIETLLSGYQSDPWRNLITFGLLCDQAKEANQLRLKR